MKNGSIDEQLKMQEKQITDTEIQPANQLNVETAIRTDGPTLQQSGNPDANNSASIQQHDSKPVEKQTNDNANKSAYTTDLGLSSILGLFTPNANNEEQQVIPPKKKKKPKRGFSQS